MVALLVVRTRPCLTPDADYLIGYYQPTYCIWFSAESILLFLKQDPEVAHLAAVYLRWVSFGLPGMIFFSFPRMVIVLKEPPTSLCF